MARRCDASSCGSNSSRRSIIAAPLVLLTLLEGRNAESAEGKRLLDTVTPMDGLKEKGGGQSYGKPRITYPDFVTTDSGLQYKDFREGTGETPKAGGTLGDREEKKRWERCRHCSLWEPPCTGCT